jgi:hypothetical protein
LKAEKCKFKCQKIEYLGLVISENQVSMDPVKVKGVTDWPMPKKVKEVQLFLGLVNFYCQFIKDFSHIACPLHALTWKASKWKWGEPQQTAFEALKCAVTTAPVLVFPSDTGKFRVEEWKQMPPNLRQELYYLSYMYKMMGSGTQWGSSPRVSQMLNATMRSMTKRC